MRNNKSHVMGYPAFGWDGVTFLPSSWYRAVFWIYDENNDDNTLMFEMLQSRAYTQQRTCQQLLMPPCQHGG